MFQPFHPNQTQKRVIGIAQVKTTCKFRNGHITQKAPRPAIAVLQLRTSSGVMGTFLSFHFQDKSAPEVVLLTLGNNVVREPSDVAVVPAACHSSVIVNGKEPVEDLSAKCHTLYMGLGIVGGAWPKPVVEAGHGLARVVDSGFSRRYVGGKVLPWPPRTDQPHVMIRRHSCNLSHPGGIPVRGIEGAILKDPLQSPDCKVLRGGDISACLTDGRTGGMAKSSQWTCLRPRRQPRTGYDEAQLWVASCTRLSFKGNPEARLPC